jgi:hypothetical protein
VTESNASKFEGAEPAGPGEKVRKGPHYRKPDIARVLKAADWKEEGT